METTTIACPQGFIDPSIEQKNAPIWTDGVNDYLVASGPREGYTTSEPIQATPDRVNVVVGMNGLDALAAMGLTVKEVAE
jgi:hypothetical protein